MNCIKKNYYQMAKIYKANGEVLDIEPKNGTDFQLEELQAIVEGHIELVYLPNNQLMVLNEEGKIMGLPYNENATKQCSVVFCESGCFDFIVGDALICNKSEIK